MLRLVLILFFVISPALIQGAPRVKKEGCGCSSKKGTSSNGGGLVGNVVGIIGGVCPHAQRIVKPVKDCGCQKAKSKCTCGNSLPPLLGKETFEAYVRRVFASKDESTDAYFARIFNKYDKESNENYVTRIDTIFFAFPWLLCKYNLDYYSVAAYYYKLKYGKIEELSPNKHENEEEYFKRILKRFGGEDFNTYIKRMDCIYKAYPRLVIWRRIQFDKDAKDWYVHRQGDYSCNIRPSLNIREKIVELYKRRDSEDGDDYSYFKRICERRTGESDKDYVERLSRIQARFPDLPLWSNSEYLCLVKDYIILKWNKGDKEDLNQYYTRLTHRDHNEDFGIYIKRMDMFETIFHYLSIWNNEECLQLTHSYYRYIYGKQGSEDNESYLKRVTAKSCSENMDMYVKRMNIVRWVCKDTDLFYNEKYLKYTKTYFEYFYKKCSETDDVWFARIFKRSFDETDDEYVRRLTMVRLVQGKLVTLDIPEKCLTYVSEYYRLLYKRWQGESKEAWIKRITIKDALESDNTYRIRLKFLGNIYTDCRSVIRGIIGRGTSIVLGKSSPKRKCKSDNNNDDDDDSSKEDSSEEDSSEEDSSEEDKKSKSPKSCSRKKKTTHKKKKNNSGEDGLEKKTKKCKSPKKKKAPKKKVEKATGIKQQNVKDDSSDTKGKTTKEESSKNKNTKDTNCGSKKSLTEEEIKKTFAKKDEEDITTYFKRITTRVSTAETTEEYITTLNVIRKYYKDLALWYDKTYIEYIKEYYTSTYTKKSTETDEEQFKRIVTKETFESDQQCAKRVDIIHELFPNLSLWSNEKYYEKFTQKLYQILYEKSATEDETTYFKRILAKTSTESDETYIGRVNLIEKTFKTLSLWYSKNTFTLIQQCYSLKYAKKSCETDKAYFKRLVDKEVCDTSDKVYAQRIRLVQEVTVNCAIWYNEEYYEKYTKTYYINYYKKEDNEACDAWLTRVIKLLPGESEKNAIKRITMVKNSTSECSCWTEKVLKRVECAFSSEYITMIKKAFFTGQSQGSSYQKKASSSSSSSKSESASQSEEEISIKAGV